MCIYVKSFGATPYGCKKKFSSIEVYEKVTRLLICLPVLCLNWCGMMLIFYIFKVKLNMVGYKLELCYLVIYKILLYAVPSMAHLDP